MISKIKIILIMLVSILFFSCGKKEKQIIRPVEIAEVLSIPENLVYEYPGIIISQYETPLSFVISGKIENMNVQVGSFVKKGDEIASLLKRDYELNLKGKESQALAALNAYKAAKAIAENAKKQFKRIKILYKEKVLSKKKYDEIIASVKAAKAGEYASLSQYEAAEQAVKFAKNQLEETKLISPYNGYITKKFLDIGAVVGAGVPVISINSVGKSKVKISVSEKDINNMDNLNNAIFYYNEKEYKLKISDISKSKGILNLAYPVTFTFEKDNENLLIDSSGIVKISFDNKIYEKGVLISIESIFEENGKINVWIYNPEKQEVQKKNIKVIKPYLDGKIIVEGLDVGEKIITKGVHELIENQKVNIVEPFSNTNVGEML